MVNGKWSTVNGQLLSVQILGWLTGRLAAVGVSEFFLVSVRLSEFSSLVCSSGNTIFSLQQCKRVFGHLLGPLAGDRELTALIRYVCGGASVRTR